MNTISKLLLPLSFLILTSSLAQTEKGNFYLGLDGALSFGRNSEKVISNDFEEDRFKTFTFRFSPAVGFFLVNNLVVGANIQYSNFTSTTYRDSFNDISEFQNKSNSIVFQNFWRYYFKAGKVLPFLEATGGIGTRNTESNFTDDIFKTSIVQFGGGAGVAVPIGKKVTLDAVLNWSGFMFKDRENNGADLKTVNQSINFSTGFSIYLGK